MSDEQMRKAAAKFRREMEKLGMGVTISMPGREPIEVVPVPCNGADDCQARVHIHGCFSDDGTNCDHLSEHGSCPSE